MSILKPFVLSVLMGIALVGCNVSRTSSSLTELKLENLLRMSLDDDFIPDREIIVSYVEIPPPVTGDQGARILVFRVHTAGMPVRYLETGGTADE